MYKSLNKIVSKFVKNLLKNRILFTDIFKFFNLIRLLYSVLCCPRNQYSKNQINQINLSHKNLLLKRLKINMFKMNDYRAAELSKSYLTTTGITILNLESIG